MRFRVLAVAFAALAIAGCGEKSDYTHFAETEGPMVDVGPLTYQVQISRFLNPADVEDREYLQGVSVAAPTGDEIWFAVFVRVKNYTDQSQQPSTTFVIKDTEGNEYHPVGIANTNPFAYRANRLPAHQVLPTPNTAAASGPIQGSLILFKLKTDSLQNRPLVLHIQQPGQDEATIDLDL